MALDKQVNIYSIDTSAFYTYYENIYIKSKYRFGVYKNKQYFENILKKVESRLKKLKKDNMDINDIRYKRCEYMRDKLKDRIGILKHIYDKRCNDVKFLLNGGEIKVKKNIVCYQEGVLEAKRSYINPTREIIPARISDKDGVSIFDSSLTRQLKLDTSKLINDSLFIVRVYYFHILKDLMDNGYYYNNEKYIFFGCSAGQIRQKKAVFIKESLYKQHEKTIMCGLTIDKINEKNGMNINKFMAYVSLINSATDIWKGFDIDKSIVVEDFETPYIGEVDYITYEEEEIDGKVYPPFSIIRREMPVAIPHTDGYGIMLDGNTTMVRLPFVKGLMEVVPFDTFIRQIKKKGKKWFKENGYDYDNFGKVKDIYGKVYERYFPGSEKIHLQCCSSLSSVYVLLYAMRASLYLRV